MVEVGLAAVVPLAAGRLFGSSLDGAPSLVRVAPFVPETADPIGLLAGGPDTRASGTGLSL